MPFLGGISNLMGKHRQEQNIQQMSREEALRRQAEFNRTAPDVRARHAVRGDILANVQPAGFTGSGRDLRVTGGLMANLLSPTTRDLGTSMNREAVLSALAAGRPGPGGPGTYGRGTNAAVPDIYSLAAPAPLKTPGFWEKALGIAGVAVPAVAGAFTGGKDPMEKAAAEENPYDYQNPNEIYG